MQKCVAFLYTSNKLPEKNNSIYNCIKKNKIPRNKSNQGSKRPVHRKLLNTDERN